MKRRLTRAEAETFACQAATPNDGALVFCPVPGCGRPPQARAGRGLSLIHCRYHVQFRNRHGSLWKGTYSAADLRPYRRAATRYLGPRHGNMWIAAALVALQSLLDRAGPNERMADVARMKPEDKARQAFARMRREAVPPLRLLVNYLAVSMAVAEDPIGPGGEPDEYRLTQIGKAALRTASGSHAVYGDGAGYHRYPRSSGLALRRIGAAIDKACEHVASEHLSAILASKREWYGARDGSNVSGLGR